MRRHLELLLACSAAVAAPLVSAQYKIIDANGRVTYTDRLPPQAERQRVQPLGLAGAISSPLDALPYELRQAARQFPVTLYTVPGCSACDNGRFYLRRRGIPYAEKTISSQADREAFVKLNLGGEVPILRIGQQVLRNFSESSWEADLDLAGYPPKPRLPAGYNGWEPTPLAEPVAAAPTAPAPTKTPAAPPSTAATEPGPSGIRF